MEMVNEITIPAGYWNGYLWESDKTGKETQVFNDTNHQGITLRADSNPFVSEALIVVNKKMSYNIRYVDGMYAVVINDIELLNKEISKDDVIEHKYIASFDGAPGKLLFKEYWRPQIDEQCLGFESLVPCEFVFIGFEKNK